MAQDKQKSNKGFDKSDHKTNSLFTEWPTPADTVAGFGGEPDKAEPNQWKSKNADGR